MTEENPQQQPRLGNSYWQIVWQQFRLNRRAMFGLYMVGAFISIAVFAPLIAGRLPLVWIENDTWYFPLVREFFAPVETTEIIFEAIFNYTVLFLAIWLVVRRVTVAEGLKRKIILGVCAVLLAVPFYQTQAKNDIRDYRHLAMEKKGWGVLPLIPYGVNEQGFGRKEAPSWYAKNKHSDGYHLLGTDEVGRDVLVRVVRGSRVSLAVGFISVGLATLIGLIVGASAGYFGGKSDIFISRLIEIIMCIPSFFLILTIIAVVDKRSILNIMLVIGITSWTGVSRLIRGEVLRERKLDYVTSAKALGAGSFRIICRHIIPNAIAPVLISVTFGIASAILMESGLSFLGIGVAPPTATWGELLNQSREGPLVNWWLVAFPGLIIFAGVTAYNLVGEGLRDAMDPRLRQ